MTSVRKKHIGENSQIRQTDILDVEKGKMCHLAIGFTSKLWRERVPLRVIWRVWIRQS